MAHTYIHTQTNTKTQNYIRLQHLYIHRNGNTTGSQTVNSRVRGKRLKKKRNEERKKEYECVVQVRLVLINMV